MSPGIKNSINMFNLEESKIAIIGLGYVGLPLAVEFGKIYNTIGYDINKNRVNELINGNDITFEVESRDINQTSKLRFSSEIDDIKNCNIFVITVPTPIDSDKKPDLLPLSNATTLIASFLKKDDIVIFESTVYPGATEEFCVPILEKKSGLKYNLDFYCGYSPERINPGDKNHRLTSIKKVTSGSNPKIATYVDLLYKSIISAGTHKTTSIKIAEAAKVIENTQRDINIALMNELSMIFNKLDIDTEAVLEAAETKWNFLPFKPGLVGGHCIGVDPYYLTFKSLEVGHNPEMILAGRRINDNMGAYIVNSVIELMTNKNIQIGGSNALIMGLTFKENCPDLRNSKVFDIVNELRSNEINVDLYDPWARVESVKQIYNLDVLDAPLVNKYDVIIFAVAHDQFKQYGIEKVKKFAKDPHIIFDVKHLYGKDEVDGRL